MHMHDMYTTPEGFQLAHPLTMPDARSFDEVLTYHGEWDYTFMNRSSKHFRPELMPASRYWPETPVPSWRGDGDLVHNEIGSFCSVNMSQLGGPLHRSIAVTITDAALESVRSRIVTDDDHMGLSVIGHAGTGRALIILNHGQIIGSHYLAYIDPTTIPAYPFKVRDAAAKHVANEIKAKGLDLFNMTPAEPHQKVYRAYKRSAVHHTGGHIGYDWQGDPITITATGEIIR